MACDVLATFMRNGSSPIFTFSAKHKLASSCLRSGDSLEMGSSWFNTAIDIAMLNPQTFIINTHSVKTQIAADAVMLIF